MKNGLSVKIYPFVSKTGPESWCTVTQKLKEIFTSWAKAHPVLFKHLRNQHLAYLRLGLATQTAQNIQLHDES